MNTMPSFIPSRAVVTYKGIQLQRCRFMLYIEFSKKAKSWRMEERVLERLIKPLPYAIYADVCHEFGAFISGDSFSINSPGIGVLKYTYKYLWKEVKTNTFGRYKDVEIILFDGKEDHQFTLDEFERDVSIRDTIGLIYTKKI